MRIIITVLLWAIIFCAGGLTGNRYGMPDAVTGITNGAFELIEGKLGGLLGSNNEGED